MQRAFEKKARYISQDDLSIRRNQAMLVYNGKIQWMGPEGKIPKSLLKLKLKEIDLKRSTILPGWVESHTHTVFSGSRADEFELKIKGATYQKIALRGGGILSTVRNTRKASFAELIQLAQLRVNQFVRQGVTTLEIKSGYALDLKNEVKILKVISGLTGPNIFSTFLGAHAKPEEFKTHSEYLNYLGDVVLPQIKKKKLSNRVDIFIESGFFEPNMGLNYLKKAKSLGFQICVHADQLSLSGGAEVAISSQALSADHLICIKEKQIKMLAQSHLTAVLLPSADLYMKCPYPPARAMIDAGVRVALATDFNPGTSPSQELSLVGLLARLEMKMTLPEVIAAYTVGGALALGLDDRGVLLPGKRADFIVLNNDWEELFYSIGAKNAQLVYCAGKSI